MRSPGIPAESVDLCSREGAELLSDQITAFWRGKGFAGIQTTIVEFKIPRRMRMRDSSESNVGYRVVSNIGPNGYPPKIPPWAELSNEISN